MEHTETVLIADDSEMIIKFLGFTIRQAGYKTLSAADGKEALDFFDGRNIDILVTDLNMPNMDGIELIEKIRSNEDYRHLPVILFVAEDDKERKKIMETSGATILFDKMNIREKMLPAIKSLLS